ncbi:MAG: ABC transporter ATP-binding protein [Desulfobacteraceae bacterium]|nr:ABC transporter ATP-binding protein [Desulfobacteraceae bacterium]
MNEILKVESLNAYYGRSQITFDIDLSVNPGEVAVVVGRNGVGKTTTLKSVMGYVEKKESRVFFKNQDITDLQPHRIAKSGLTFVPDNGGVFHNLSVEDNFNVSEREGAFSRDYVFELFPKIKNILKRKGAHLSGGERKMVGISKGLLMNPDLLIIDEPSEGLAPSLVKDIAAAINKLEEKISLVVADQNLAFILSIADRIYIMDGGRIKRAGTKEEIKKEEIEEFLAL